MIALDSLASWVRIDSMPEPGAQALFLDRDGTVIENMPYLTDPDEVVLIPGAQETITAFRAAGYAVVIVTNQSGVARGLVTQKQYEAVTSRMLGQLGPGLVDAVFACPFHPMASGIYGRDHHWRKPAPGMLVEAAMQLALDLSASMMVGDSLSDVQAGIAAGVDRVAHVMTGHGEAERAAVEVCLGSQRKRSRVEFVQTIGEIRPTGVAP